MKIKHEKEIQEKQENNAFRLSILSKVDKFDDDLLLKLLGLENNQQIKQIPPPQQINQISPQQILQPQMYQNYQLNMPYQGPINNYQCPHYNTPI